MLYEVITIGEPHQPGIFISPVEIAHHKRKVTGITAVRTPDSTAAARRTEGKGHNCSLVTCGRLAAKHVGVKVPVKLIPNAVLICMLQRKAYICIYTRFPSGIGFSIKCVPQIPGIQADRTDITALGKGVAGPGCC